MGSHDGRRRETRAFRPNHHCWFAIIVLGWRAATEPDALYRRLAGRDLAHRYCWGISETASSTARGSSSNFENLNPANTLMDKALQSLFQGRQRGAALSRIRAVVGRACAAQRRGNAVHFRRVVRRQ